jgi:hypothetical protein
VEIRNRNNLGFSNMRNGVTIPFSQYSKGNNDLTISFWAFCQGKDDVIVLFWTKHFYFVLKQKEQGNVTVPMKKRRVL